jgi:hypothetical protein
MSPTHRLTVYADGIDQPATSTWLACRLGRRLVTIFRPRNGIGIHRYRRAIMRLERLADKVG